MRRWALVLVLILASCGADPDAIPGGGDERPDQDDAGQDASGDGADADDLDVEGPDEDPSVDADPAEDVAEDAQDAEDAIEDAIEDVTEDVTEDAIEDVTEDATEDAQDPEDAIEDTAPDVAEDVIEDVSEDVPPEIPPGIPPERSRRLARPMQQALDRLTCGSAPSLRDTKDYGISFDFNHFELVGDHVQSVVYTGPMEDGSGLVWYSRSDTASEARELFMNQAGAGRLDADGSLDGSNDAISRRGTYEVDGEDHAAQVEWLPDWSMDGVQRGGYLFVAASDNRDVRIFHYRHDNGDFTEVTGPGTRLRRQGEDGPMGQVYITYAHARYWLVMGASNNFEVHVADVGALFPGGAGSLDPAAFQLHGVFTTRSGGGANCYLVTDSTDTIYRLCSKHDTLTNCVREDNADNTLLATRVTITPDAFQIEPEFSASVTLGHWGADSNGALCVSTCDGITRPTFRASGSPYVDRDGELNVYSLAFGGKDTSSCLDNTGTSQGRLMGCEE